MTVYMIIRKLEKSDNSMKYLPSIVFSKCFYIYVGILECKEITVYVEIGMAAENLIPLKNRRQQIFYCIMAYIIHIYNYFFLTLTYIKLFKGK